MNAPLHRHANPYATLCTQVRAAEAHEDAIAASMDDTLQRLKAAPMQRVTAWWDVRPVAPLVHDVVAWVLETHGDPEESIGRVLIGGSVERDKLYERYALARAEAETRNRNFAAEAEEARAWEAGGHV
jgi:hypothetical protein